MPKKKQELSPAEQSKLFRKKIREMVAAGDLSLTEADEQFERATAQILKARRLPPPPNGGGEP